MDDERAASAGLKEIRAATADFREHDRENDRAQNYWVADVRGLYALCPSTNGLAVPGSDDVRNARQIKLIQPGLAAADAAPIAGPGLSNPPVNPVPKSGYLFRAIPWLVMGAKIVPYGATGGLVEWGKLFNYGRFAFCAYPADYGVTGRRTFIVGEDGTVYWKDTGGEAPLRMPGIPDQDGWTLLK